MWLDSDRFRLHDVASFPLVWTRVLAHNAADARQWQAEMDALLAQDSSFVLLHHVGDAEPQEARKARAVWFKHNKRAMARLCLALVAIEPDPVRRMALKARAAILNQSYGVKAAVAATAAEGEDLAWEILFCAPSNNGSLGVFPAE